MFRNSPVLLGVFKDGLQTEQLDKHNTGEPSQDEEKVSVIMGQQEPRILSEELGFLKLIRPWIIVAEFSACLRKLHLMKSSFKGSILSGPAYLYPGANDGSTNSC